MNEPRSPHINDEKKPLTIIRPSILPLLLSFDNVILIAFLAVAAIFGTYLRLGAFELLIIILIGLVVLLPPVFRALHMSKERYHLYEHQLVIFRNTKKKLPTNIPANQITRVRCKRALFDRFLGTGNIFIRTNDQKHEIRMINVPNCMQVIKQIKRTAKIR